MPETYVPHVQAPLTGMGIVVRTQGIDPAAILPAARQRIAAIDPDLPIMRPQTLVTVGTRRPAARGCQSALTGVFALLAGLLASVGIYSLIAYSVAERTRELGIRVALGADHGAVVRLIVGEGLVLAATGVTIGLLGSWLLTGTLKTMLYEVSPIDPVVLTAAVARCCWCRRWRFLRARAPRASASIPMIALRAD